MDSTWMHSYLWHYSESFPSHSGEHAKQPSIWHMSWQNWFIDVPWGNHQFYSALLPNRRSRSKTASPHVIENISQQWSPSMINLAMKLHRWEASLSMPRTFWYPYHPYATGAAVRLHQEFVSHTSCTRKVHQVLKAPWHPWSYISPCIKLISVIASMAVHTANIIASMTSMSWTGSNT